MTATQLGMLAGALAGLGVFLALWAMAPPAKPELAAALTRLTTATPLPSQSTRRSDGPFRRRTLGRLAAYSAGRGGVLLGAPARDLALLGQTFEGYVAARLAWAGVGFALPTVAWAGLTLAGVGPPVIVPAGVGPAAAIGLSLLPVLSVREQAARARTDFARTTSAYLDLVAQERATGASPTQALRDAAAVGQGWVFTRITQVLLHAPRVGISEWQALADLGEQVGVAELADLADIIASAAGGSAVYTTLTTKAAALRTAALAADQAAANAASERLALPVSLLGIAFVLLVFYPAFTQLLTAGRS